MLTITMPAPHVDLRVIECKPEEADANDNLGPVSVDERALTLAATDLGRRDST